MHRLGADGTFIAGWPVRLPGSTASVYSNLFTIGCGDQASSVILTSDGSVVLAVVDDDAVLHVLDENGEPRPGWPRPFPGDAPWMDGIGGNGCRGFDLGPDGSILAWGYEGVEQDIELNAARTEFMVYEPDGRTRSGWPRGSTGAASRPVFGADGSVTYVSASGKVWRHEADGTINDGWPYELSTKAGPYLSPDGRIIVFTGDRGSRDAISLGRTGEVTDGWPVPLGNVQTRCLFGDTPCAGSVAPVFGREGTLYVALGDGSVIAIDPVGQIVSGWPVDLGNGTHATALTVDGDDLLVTAVTCRSDAPCDEGDEVTPFTLVFAADGTPVDAGAS